MQTKVREDRQAFIGDCASRSLENGIFFWRKNHLSIIMAQNRYLAVLDTIVEKKRIQLPTKSFPKGRPYRSINVIEANINVKRLPS